MSWFPVDDAFHSHPKVRKAGLEAVGLWTLAGSHCMAYLTDGFVAEWWVREKPKGLALAKRLVDAGLWRTAKREGEQGFQFHDWKRECTKAYVLAAREKARQRKARSRADHEESRVTDDVTDGVSHACVPSTTQPNPTQPINTGVDLGGGVTKVDARGPRPHCSNHPNYNPDGEKCRPCGRRREWDEAQDDVAKADELDEKRRQRESRQAAVEACNECDEDGWRYDNREVNCNHKEQRHA